MASLTHKGETKRLRDSKCKLLPLDFVGNSISCALMSRTHSSLMVISLNTLAFSSYTLKLSLRKWLKTISKSSSYLNWPTTLKSMCHLKTSRRLTNLRRGDKTDRSGRSHLLTKGLLRKQGTILRLLLRKIPVT